MKPTQKEFKARLKELVVEVNSLGIYFQRFIGSGFHLKATGEIHYHDYYICLNVNGLPTNGLIQIMKFIEKYNGTLVLHPVRNNDTLAIRINDTQFFNI